MPLIYRISSTPNAASSFIKGSPLTYAEGDGNIAYLLTNMSGSTISITGDTTVTGPIQVVGVTQLNNDVYLSGIPESAKSHVLSFDSASGQVYYQSTSSILASVSVTDAAITTDVATTASLPGSPVYNNGTAGVGAFISSSVNSSVGPIDGVSMTIGDRILVKDQAAQLQNGVYEVTVVGSVSTKYVLTRTTDSDETSELDSQIVVVGSGSLNGGGIFTQITNNPTVGTDDVVYTRQSSTLVTQGAAGNQTIYQIPWWTGVGRELSKGSPNFTYTNITVGSTVTTSSLRLTGSLDVSGSGRFTNGLTVTGSTSIDVLNGSFRILSGSANIFETSGSREITLHKWSNQQIKISSTNDNLASIEFIDNLSSRNSYIRGGSNASYLSFGISGSGPGGIGGNINISPGNPANNYEHILNIGYSGDFPMRAVINSRPANSINSTASLELVGSINTTDYGVKLAFNVGDAQAGGNLNGSGILVTKTNVVGFSDPTNVTTNMIFYTRDGYTVSEKMRISNSGSVGIGTTNPITTLDVSGSGRFTQFVTASAALFSGSGVQRLRVIGSGSSEPLMQVLGSQGELFTVTDSLSGSLFSVNDISGLPVVEAFSDSTVLIGSYQAPALNTTVLLPNTTVGVNTIYTVPTASYDAVYMDYVIRSESVSRAGTFTAMWSGSSTSFTDVSGSTFGDSSGFVIGANVTGSSLLISGSGTTAGWRVKTIIRSI